MKSLALNSFRLKNFKAVRDSGTIKFDPLTVFVGFNGSGKSSLIEGLEFLQVLAIQGLDEAVRQWRGFEHIWNQSAPRTNRRDPATQIQCLTNAMSFDFQVGIQPQRRPRQGWIRGHIEISTSPGGNDLFIQREVLKYPSGLKLTRSAQGSVQLARREDDPILEQTSAQHGELASSRSLRDFYASWQFLSLNPAEMGSPILQRRTGGRAQLVKSGANIAEYLLDIRDQSVDAFNGIVETLKYVLPYADDLRPAITQQLDRSVYLELVEGHARLPGWLLSTGTLRVAAILAVLRNPNPPPLLVIEEIENGLDPRSINLVIEEIRSATESGRTQVIATTHSPYLLDLLSLEHIVLVERQDGEPRFTRPADQQSLEGWAERYGPGRLYTMGQLKSGAAR